MSNRITKNIKSTIIENDKGEITANQLQHILVDLNYTQWQNQKIVVGKAISKTSMPYMNYFYSDFQCKIKFDSMEELNNTEIYINDVLIDKEDCETFIDLDLYTIVIKMSSTNYNIYTLNTEKTCDDEIHLIGGNLALDNVYQTTCPNVFVENGKIVNKRTYNHNEIQKRLKDYKVTQSDLYMATFIRETLKEIMKSSHKAKILGKCSSVHTASGNKIKKHIWSTRKRATNRNVKFKITSKAKRRWGSVYPLYIEKFFPPKKWLK